MEMMKCSMTEYFNVWLQVWVCVTETDYLIKEGKGLPAIHSKYNMIYRLKKDK